MELGLQIATKLDAYPRDRQLAPDDLFFTVSRPAATSPKLKAVPSPDQLGQTAPNENGRCYQHGTLSGYNAGRCRCGRGVRGWHPRRPAGAVLSPPRRAGQGTVWVKLLGTGDGSERPTSRITT